MKEKELSKLRPRISISRNKNCITVGRDVIRALENPDYICMLENKEQHSIAFVPCESSNVMSFRVPEKALTDHHCIFRICSKRYVDSIATSVDLEMEQAVEFYGSRWELGKAVIFELNQVR